MNEVYAEKNAITQLKHLRGETRRHFNCVKGEFFSGNPLISDTVSQPYEQSIHYDLTFVYPFFQKNSIFFEAFLVETKTGWVYNINVCFQPMQSLDNEV